MISVLALLVLAAFVCTVAAALQKCPLWIAVVFLCIVELVHVMPLR